MLTDGRTDRRTSSIHKPELLCNQAQNVTHILTRVYFHMESEVVVVPEGFLTHRTAEDYIVLMDSLVCIGRRNLQ